MKESTRSTTHITGIKRWHRTASPTTGVEGRKTILIYRGGLRKENKEKGATSG